MGKCGLVGCLRIGVLVFGLVVLAIAYFGHEFSSYKVGLKYDYNKEHIEVPPYYEICMNGSQPDLANKTEYTADEIRNIDPKYSGGPKVEFRYRLPPSKLKPCPSPMLEKVFIFILGTTFVVTIVFLVLSFKFKPGGKWHPSIQKIEFIYDLVAAVLLVLGAILFLACAVMINNIYNMEYEKFLNQGRDELAVGGISVIPKIKFYFIVKLVAAILGLGLVPFYVVLALMIKKAIKAEANAVSPSGNAGGGGPKQDPTQDEANQLSQNPSATGPPPE